MFSLACVVSRGRVFLGEMALAERLWRLLRSQPGRHNRHNPLPKSVDFDGHSSPRLWLALLESVFLGV